MNDVEAVSGSHRFQCSLPGIFCTGLVSLLIVLMVMTASVDAQDRQEMRQKIQQMEQRLDELEKTEDEKDDESKPNDLRVYFSDGSGKLNWETADGRFSGELGGRIMYDWTVGSIDDSLEDAGISDADGTEFRRARLFTEGSLYDIGYKFQVDFAGAPVELKSVYLDFPTPIEGASLKVGKFKEDMSLAEKTSSKYITMMARPILTEWAGGRDLGAQLGGGAVDGRLHYGIGVFRADNVVAGRSSVSDGDHKVTGRVAFLPWTQDDMSKYLHVGASGSVASLDNSSTSSEDHEPEVHLADDFVDTGAFGPTKGDTRVGLETALTVESFTISSEYMQRTYDVDGVSDPTFDSWYVESSYFLTGEVRPYDGGEFDRVSPASNFLTDGGTGAWEVAARYSTMDLNDAGAGVTGGETDIITLGLNWYLNPSVRIMTNFTNADVTDAAGNPGVNGDGNFLSMRFQIDF